MLGVVGFSLAAVMIGAFAWTSQHAYRTLEPLRKNAFTTAFWLLAIAMVLWGITVAANNTVTTNNLMLASDVLLLLGSACMVIAFLGEFSPLFLAILGGVVAVLVAWRAYTQPPTAYVSNGILYFNLEGISRYFIVGLFAVIWLPGMMLVANRVANDRLLTRSRFTLQMFFILLVVLMATFAKAKRTDAIIYLFGAIILVFLLATVFNIALQKADASIPLPEIPEKEPKKRNGHAAKRSPAK